MSEEVKADEPIKVEKIVDQEIKSKLENKESVNGNCNVPEEAKDVEDNVKKPPADEENTPSEDSKPEQMNEKMDTNENTNGKSAETKEESKPSAKEDQKEETEDKNEKTEDKKEEIADKTKESNDNKEDVEDKTKDGESSQTTEDDEDEESDSDEELPPGLLERPIEILKEKRERKKTSRFTYDDVPATPGSNKKKVEIPEGRGVKLGEHPRVEWQLQRNKIEDLKILHKLFFGVFGDANCKKNMRNFCGFAFEKDSPEYEKKEEYLGRFTLDNLKWAMTVCDVDKKSKIKDDYIDNLLGWCLDPRPSGKEIPEKKKKQKKEKKKKRKPTKSAEKAKSQDKTLSSGDSSDDESEVTPKKNSSTSKKQKKSTPKKTPKSATKRKTTPTQKKISKVKIGSPKKAESSDYSDDGNDEPVEKKTKKAPTNAQIRKQVEKILKGADLEVITMKAVCMKIYALYPDFDLSDKKSFIKDTVKSIIS